MLKFSIVYFGDVYAINGVNFVTKLLMEGDTHFQRRHLKVNKLVSLNGILDSQEYFEKRIGYGINFSSNKLKAKVRHYLAKLLTSNNKYFAWFKLKSTMLKPAKKVVDSYDFRDDDLIVFQDLFSAYFYLISPKNENAKTLLILHCSKDPFEQLLGYYPSIVNSHFHEQLLNMQRVVYEKINHVVFLSNSALSFNKKLLANKSSFIYNGISGALAAGLSPSTDSATNLVCVGSINGHKGQEILIDAINILKDEKVASFKLFFIGSGSDEQRLISKVEKLRLTHLIEFLGVRNDVVELLNTMDVMILASKSEGMPISILEGMRQGLFICSTKVGAIPEMINGDFGAFVERDPKQIRDVLLAILNDRDRINKAKVKSREYFLAHFTHEIMIDRYSALIKELDEQA